MYLLLDTRQVMTVTWARPQTLYLQCIPTTRIAAQPLPLPSFFTPQKSIGTPSWASPFLFTNSS